MPHLRRKEHHIFDVLRKFIRQGNHGIPHKTQDGKLDLTFFVLCNPRFDIWLHLVQPVVRSQLSCIRSVCLCFASGILPVYTEPLRLTLQPVKLPDIIGDWHVGNEVEGCFSIVLTVLSLLVLALSCSIVFGQEVYIEHVELSRNMMEC